MRDQKDCRLQTVRKTIDMPVVARLLLVHKAGPV